MTLMADDAGNISEAASKKKRGRPRKFSPDLVAAFRGVYPETKTARGIQDKVYLSAGYNALKGAVDFRERYRWLIGDDGETLRIGIITELGRIPDPEEVRHVADAICQHRLRGKDAIVRIRRFRLGEKAGTWLRLAAELEDTLNAYLVRYPKTPNEDVVRAVRVLLDEVTEEAPPP